jgi:MGT family glycosyltransferase
MMPKSVFFNVPGHGHVNPSLPMVAELARRGHQITYFITEKYRARVEAVGAKFQPYTSVPDDYFEARRLDGGHPQKVAYNLITTAEEILPELLKTTQAIQPDYIMFDGMCPWGYLVARILNITAVTSLALMPLTSPPPSALLNFQLVSLILPMVFRDFGMGLEANKCSRALGKKYNIAPLGPMTLLNAYGDICISYTSSYFQPFASTVSEAVRFVGWTLNESAADDSFPFEPGQGKPLIYVSLGTINNDDVAFFKTCIEAFTGSDYFIVMSTGNGIDPESFGVLPENIVIRSWIPQIDVLKRAALFITHGGMNSLHDGLYLGVPLLLVPQQAEQTLNALRVVELGAGLMLKKAQVNAEALRTNAAQLLATPRFKAEAERIGDTLRAAGGATRAADEVELLMQKHAVGT